MSLPRGELRRLRPLALGSTRSYAGARAETLDVSTVDILALAMIPISMNTDNQPGICWIGAEQMLYASCPAASPTWWFGPPFCGG